MFVEIALNIPSDKLFTYEVPTELEQGIVVGKRVFVPFGNKKRNKAGDKRPFIRNLFK